ncbi:MAG: Crp/Fnr family transcriptional regulator [Thermodesulfobacteriota bacterium]|jgi:CRP-like cAMP-binding protein
MNGIDLGAISLFEGLDQRELELIRPIFTRREYPPEAKVIEEGEPGQEMFILISGKVRVVKAMVLPGVDLSLLGGKDPRKVLATLTGENHPFFGEMGLVSDSPRSATVETVEPCTFLVTGRRQFLGLTAGEPELGCKLLTALSARLADLVRTANTELIKLTTALALVLSERR